MSNYTYQHDPRISGADFEDDDEDDVSEVDELRQELHQATHDWNMAMRDMGELVKPLLDLMSEGEEDRVLDYLDENMGKFRAYFDPESRGD